MMLVSRSGVDINGGGNFSLGLLLVVLRFLTFALICRRNIRDGSTGGVRYACSADALRGRAARDATLGIATPGVATRPSL